MVLWLRGLGSTGQTWWLVGVVREEATQTNMRTLEGEKFLREDMGWTLHSEFGVPKGHLKGQIE